ncbi:MAG TPA: hypothetical protein VFN35_04950 [Ktedonobacteraceae bacterium]|nr:hypothetical protein [Ktedonobacteraceae bacterium]
MDKQQGQKIAAAGATLTIAETALFAMHTSGVGALVGLAAAGVVWWITDEIQQSHEDEENTLPATPVQKSSEAKPGKASLAYRLFNGKSVRGEDGQTALTSPNGLPRRSPPFAQMKHLIPKGVDVLGFDGRRFICADPFNQSVNMAAIGLPRSGKTTFLTFQVAQAVMRGAEVRGWDIHGDVAKSLGELFHIIEDVDEILKDAKGLRKELDRRRALRRRATKQNHDKAAQKEWAETRELCLIVDEFMALMTRLKVDKSKRERQELVSTILLLIAEGAKYKVRLVLAGQTMPASLFGDDGSSARDIISTKYVFLSRDDQARMFGLDPKGIENLLPLLSANSKGYAVLAGGPLLQSILISIPNTTVEDIKLLLKEYGYFEQREAEKSAGANDITQEDVELIAGLYEAGWTLKEIALASSGWDLRTFKRACDLAGIEITPPQQSQQSEDTEPQAALKLMPKPKTGPRKATLPDAIAVWDAIKEPIGRPRLQKELQNRGFECSDDLAKILLGQIKDSLEEQAAAGGVAVGGGDE